MDLTQKYKISVVGLGYVGLPVAVAFGKVGYNVCAFDINEERINELKKNIDRTHEIETGELKDANLFFTNDPEDLKGCNFHIVTVPTPVDDVNRPDLTPLLKASETLGRAIKRGDIIVYESTVYPGATVQECVPILENFSDFIYNKDFFVGYSPERINPGDKEHRFETIMKIVSGSTPTTLKAVSAVYGSVVKAGVHEVTTIETAEAAKVIENVQRDLNIAFVNELSLIFKRIGIDTNDVIEAAGTKWNFMKFKPGIVGGHCIDIDPYYLTYCAEKHDYYPEVILAGRRTNMFMPYFIASEIVKELFKIKDQRPIVTILGCTFKENINDIRNSKVFEIANELKRYGVFAQISDPYASPQEVLECFGFSLIPLEHLSLADIVVLAVPHKPFVKKGWLFIKNLLKSKKGSVFDLKSALPKKEVPGYVSLWRL